MKKRYKVLELSGEILLSMFSNGMKPTHEISGGIPADARIVNVKHGWPNSVTILLESPQVEEIPEGETIPSMAITQRVLGSIVPFERAL